MVWDTQLFADYLTLLYQYHINENIFEYTHELFNILYIIVFSHISINIVKLCWENRTHWEFIIYPWTCAQVADIWASWVQMYLWIITDIQDRMNNKQQNNKGFCETRKIKTTINHWPHFHWHPYFKCMIRHVLIF